MERERILQTLTTIFSAAEETPALSDPDSVKKGQSLANHARSLLIDLQPSDDTEKRKIHDCLKALSDAETTASEFLNGTLTDSQMMTVSEHPVIQVEHALSRFLPVA